ncbi:ribosomal protein L21e [Kipferlia bialata]|uniref:Ribosomal protein L21e n=1 Tax=Kipferlia bialata TaxID=797122 RepID=A0A9K3CZ24_9EUKA|nr:ribosomal protein L21e [Kipferlia bialata]GIQ84289.1 ribosomal protein L21e [Kipferlia bialata]|eukprot:g3155.t1
MTHSYGYRAKTRHTFSQDFRKKGTIALSKYLTTYKRGDYVDIKMNGAQQKGMAYRFYHGRTGVVFNVSPSSVGVEMNKRVGGRIMKKRIHVRVEHVKPSNCKKQHIQRVLDNAAAKVEARATGIKTVCKRTVGTPRPAHIVKAPKITDVTPVKFHLIV